MQGRIGEFEKVFTEILPVTSAAGATSLVYHMGDCVGITFVGGLATADGTTAVTPVMSVRQSGDKALATSAVITGATATLGSATGLTLRDTKQMILTAGTDTTAGDVLVINGVTLTYSTSPAATSLLFGTTVGVTAAEGLEEGCNSLSSVINASTVAALRGITASTGSATNTVRLIADDTASTGVSITSTGSSAWTLTNEKSISIVEVLAEDLNSTSKYVACLISTCDTAVNVSLTAIKHGVRYKPADQKPVQIHTKTT